ncbi:MAG: hypothetical protein ACTSPD_09015 [Promethearchaeota archaeon]
MYKRFNKPKKGTHYYLHTIKVVLFNTLIIFTFIFTILFITGEIALLK